MIAGVALLSARCELGKSRDQGSESFVTGGRYSMPNSQSDEEDCVSLSAMLYQQC
jgi:hypothetical protein